MSAPFDAFTDHPENIHEYYAEGGNINKRVTSAQLNEYIFKDGYKESMCHRGLLPTGYNNGVVLTKQAWDIMEYAAKLANGYNFDDSDGMIDYFHTNFYLHIEIGRWDKPFQIN